MKRQQILAAVLITAVVSTLAATGCGSQRLAMDYQIKIDREFAVEHIKETEVFQSGEKFHFRVTTHNDGYLYILNRGPAGDYNILYPRPVVKAGSAFVPGWEHVIVPAHGSFQFDEQAGIETVIICWSAKAVGELERIVRGELSDPAEIEPILHALEAESRRDGKFKKVHHRKHTQVVLRSPREDAIMVNTVRLEHAPLETE
ncbi:MAG: DUF4384 domain-containing protein [Phycisphaerae bacterium]|nr:DUF4384 domain-containing protein [Phycisphaerae bacterium]